MTQQSTKEQSTKSIKEPNIPAGYKEQSEDIFGFWDSTSGETIHMIPRFFRLFDSKLDPTKASTLLIAELVEPIRVENSKGETVIADKGELVGVWTKAGMVAIKNLGGVDVYMYQKGEKDTGKGNPMKLYKILSQAKGVKVPFSGDFRKRSLPAGHAPIDSAEDDIPF
jgi:hypothetical protein